LFVYTPAQWCLFFLIYSFLGWCIESGFVSLHERRFVNRGFLRGPVIPIYGTGAVAILFATLPVRRSLAAAFLLGTLAATVLEYVTGAAMEALFQVRYWDYTHKPCNLRGYICLERSLDWGLLTLVLLRLHDVLARPVLALPQTAARVLAACLGAFFLADAAVSTRAALDLRALLAQLDEYARRAREDAARLQKRAEVYTAFKLDGHLQKLPSGLEQFAKRIESFERGAARLEPDEALRALRAELGEWKARRDEIRKRLAARMTWDKRALLRGNPGARSRRYGAGMELLRVHLKERKEK